MGLITSPRVALFWSACALAGAYGGYTQAGSSEAVRAAPRPEAPASCLEQLAAPVRVTPSEAAPPSEVRRLTPRECDLMVQDDQLRRAEHFFTAGRDVEPLAWAAHVDVEQERDRFEASLEEGLADCGSDAVIVGVDCSEAPCVALVEGSYDSLGCGEAVFEGGGWTAAQKLLCPDGTRQELSLVAPAEIPEGLVAAEADLPSSQSPRFLARFADLRDTVRCVEW